MSDYSLTIENLQESCSRLGFEFDAHTLAGVETYLTLLMKWNRVMNLVGARTWHEALANLLVDSFHLARFFESLTFFNACPAPSCLDLGAGAGLPGIPLRMLWNKGKYTLVEVREKRAIFMETALASLALPQTFVFHGRAENILERDAPVDVVTSRAFMPWEKLLDLVKNYLAPGGLCVLSMLEPCPTSLPASWTNAGQYEYKVSGSKAEGRRFFWALQAGSGAAV